MSKQISGGVLITIAAFFWGISGTVAKMLFNSSINPFNLVNMRLNLAFTMLFIYFLITRRDLVKVKPGDLKHFAILGIFGIMGVQSTYYFTVATLNVAMAIFLQFLSPMLVTTYCVIFQKERMDTAKTLSLVLSIIGSFLIIFGRGGAHFNIKLIGLVSGIASAFFCAFYNIYSKKCTDKYNSWTVLLYALGSGALFYWFVSPPWVLWRGIGRVELLFVIYIAVFATIIPFGLYLYGLRYLIPTTASIIAMLEPVVASMSAFLILGEAMSLPQILGGALVIGAVILIQLKQGGGGKPEAVIDSSSVNDKTLTCRSYKNIRGL